ncbi:hypothetical protein SBC1_56190 (plasmid) [Caballeronia sp. SBC1]|nr:hypothetical protein SBC2_55870 [Caballeronia sp. SBC2]QIN65574.1 hypothetical protein SBC1_56190 [Caballeronia sp. SBC1]
MSRLRASLLTHLARSIRTLRAKLSRPERLLIYLSRGGLAVCVAKGRFRPVVRIKAILPIATRDCDDTDGATAALDALTEWLKVHPVQGVIEWVIGIDYVRYLLLPWDERLSSSPFCLALAAALFAQQFSGSDVSFSAYQLRFARLAFGRPRLTVLISSELLSELNEFASRHRYRSRRITPALSVVWDSLFARVKNGAGVLALVEGQRLLRVSYDRGQFTSVSVQPFCEEQTPVIPSDITYLFPPRNIAVPGGENLPLQDPISGDDARFAYALCGVL